MLVLQGSSSRSNRRLMAQKSASVGLVSRQKGQPTTRSESSRSSWRPTRGTRTFGQLLRRLQMPHAKWPSGSGGPKGSTVAAVAADIGFQHAAVRYLNIGKFVWPPAHSKKGDKQTAGSPDRVQSAEKGLGRGHYSYAPCADRRMWHLIRSLLL